MQTIRKPIFQLALALGLLGTVACRAGAADTIPLESFAEPDQVIDVSIAPDGHHVAIVTTAGDLHTAMVSDLTASSHAATPVLADDGKKFSLFGCQWATNTRLVCSYRGLFSEEGHYYVATRMVAVDADGKNQKLLLQNSGVVTGQFQDEVIDWHPGKADTVLVLGHASLVDEQARKPGTSFFGQTESAIPAVFELNVVTGAVNQVLGPYDPISKVLTDFHGHARIGEGVVSNSTTTKYFVRSSVNPHWEELLQFKLFEGTNKLEPVSVDTRNTDRAFALGYKDGRRALWSIDLTDKKAPEIVYANPFVDVSGPIILKDGAFIGVSYEAERPHEYYTDPVIADLMHGVNDALPNTFNTIVDASADRSVLIVLARSDQEPGTYYMLEPGKGKLAALGHANRKLVAGSLGRMLAIKYPARDGTQIPGYLTRPPGQESAQHLPLIVMPHGGPIHRDSWEYFFLQQFLVSRGYAVLQMNFRGSSGYGHDWFHAAHQDWGGLTYDDVIDGARWAISTGIADPKRVAIVGWSFGGYIAELAATRNSDLFKCAISIAGVSDLKWLEAAFRNTGSLEVARQQIGTNSDKLSADSPRRHAADIKIPVLLIHGSTDPQVDVDQSRAMAAALAKANKPYEYIEIKDADHQIRRKDDRIRLLQAVEKQLSAVMSPQ